MKIAAVCCTYLRPKHLGWLIQCFLEQDYPDRELVILDDVDQYDSQRGDRWELVSVRRRFRFGAACSPSWVTASSRAGPFTPHAWLSLTSSATTSESL